uniref:F-box protein 22 n=1 Tax=Erpetoichthys calabaricus TaxID=27687 RepID=A0A8C4TL72_ERPCA
MDVVIDFSDTPGKSKAGYILSNVAEVVERILTFVPTKSLLHAACVCRLWKDCSRRVLRRQQKMTWISTFSNHTLSKALAEDLENVYLLPHTVLLMAAEDTLNSSECQYREKKSRKTWRSRTAAEYEKLFPKGCNVVGIVTPGIVLTPMGSSCNQPQEFEDGEAGFAVLFPKVEGVNFRSFHFCKKNFSSTALEEAGLVNNPGLRVVLLFGYEAFRPEALRFLNHIIEPLSKENILLAGGHVEYMMSPDTKCCCHGSYGVVGLALSGSRIQGASVLLEQDVNSEKAAKEAVQRLKAAKIPEHNTVGFMFACVGRGQNHYNFKKNVEADIFRVVFPNIPLFGFFGKGEIGCDRIITDNYTLSEADNLQHGYTTVMALVHLG